MSNPVGAGGTGTNAGAVWLGALTGILAFLGTTYPFGDWMLIPLGLWLFVSRPLRLVEVSGAQYVLVWLFVAFALANFAFHAPSTVDGSLSALAVMLYPLTVVLAAVVVRSISLTRAFLALVILEALIGVVEFYFATPAPWPGQLFAEAHIREDASGIENLYFMRVFGLSGNSSIFAQAAFVALILAFVHRDRLSAWWRVGAILAVVAALFTTFNRAAILALGPLLAYMSLREIRIYLGKWAALAAGVAIAVVPIIFLAALSPIFLRGLDDFDVGALAGRDKIWDQFISAIWQHPWFGNGSVKLLVEAPSGAASHAHNSFIELLATHGLIVSAPLLIAIGLGVRWAIVLPMLAILTYSLFQYGVFWNFSLMDIVLWATLMRPFCSTRAVRENPDANGKEREVGQRNRRATDPDGDMPKEARSSCTGARDSLCARFRLQPHDGPSRLTPAAGHAHR